MNVVCLEDKALLKIIDECLAYVKKEHGIKEEKWITTEKAMAMLGITSKTSLQKYRDEGEIIYTELSPRHFLYDRESILEFLERKSRDKF